MPQEQERRQKPPTGPSQPQDDFEKKKRSPIDKELDDLIDEADEIIKKNKEDSKKKQPTRE